MWELLYSHCPDFCKSKLCKGLHSTELLIITVTVMAGMPWVVQQYSGWQVLSISATTVQRWLCPLNTDHYLEVHFNYYEEILFYLLLEIVDKDYLLDLYCYHWLHWILHHVSVEFFCFPTNSTTSTSLTQWVPVIPAPVPIDHVHTTENWFYTGEAIHIYVHILTLLNTVCSSLLLKLSDFQNIN